MFRSQFTHPCKFGETGSQLSPQKLAYVDKNSDVPAGIQSALGKMSAKVPFWDYHQIPYIDAWGRMEENASNTALNAAYQFLSPAYISTPNASDMEDELGRLYQSTKDSPVLSTRAPKYFTLDGERLDLSAQQYLDYASDRGTLAYQTMTKLTGSKMYQSLSNEARVEAVKGVCDYANQLAKKRLVGYKVDNWATAHWR